MTQSNKSTAQSSQPESFDQFNARINKEIFGDTEAIGVFDSVPNFITDDVFGIFGGPVAPPAKPPEKTQPTRKTPKKKKPVRVETPTEAEVSYV